MHLTISNKRSSRSVRSSNLLPPIGQVGFLLGLTCVFGAIAAASAATVSPPQTELDFKLEDQFGRVHDSSELVDKRLIFVGGDRDASDDSRAWALETRKLVDTVESSPTRFAILRVADLRTVPAGLKALVAKKMRGRYEAPVLMDWQGTLADRLGFQSGLANVVIVDDFGEVQLLMQAKQPEPQQIELMRQVLVALDRFDLGDESAPSPSSMSGPGL